MGSTAMGSIVSRQKQAGSPVAEAAIAVLSRLSSVSS